MSGMMIIVSVKDRAADGFMRPFYVPRNEMAIRSFTDEVNRSAPDNPIYQHPEDYDLYEIGVFDEDTGEIHGNKILKLLVRGQDVKK